MMQIIAKHRELGEALVAAKVEFSGSRLLGSETATIVRTGLGEPVRFRETLAS